MHTISRRQFLAQSLASTAAACATGTFPSLLASSGSAFAATQTVLRAQSRVIDIGGRAATVFGLQQPDGTHGLTIDAGQEFAVRLQNGLDAPTLIHWHGLTPPHGQDGVPDMPQPLLPAGQTYEYRFPLTAPGTHWMHAHTLQEQQLLAAPLIVNDPAEASLDEQPVVVLFHDFSFRAPEELLAGLTGSSGGHGGMAMGGTSMGGMAGHSMPATGGMGAGMAMDINDIDYDAYLANDRTLDDPQIFSVERNGTVRLRLINGATATAFWIDTGALEGEAIAVDGNPIVPVSGRRFPLAMGQRIDIRLRIPAEDGAWPILALREGAVEQTGFVLATAAGAVKRIATSAQAAAEPLDLALEAGLRAAIPLAPAKDARRKEIVLGGSMDSYAWTLNGRVWGSHDLIEARSGDRVEIAMRNDSMMGHPMHLHGHHFQVVEIDGRRIEGAMRDTVWLPPQRQLTVAFEASNPGEWAFHCHHLYHMATGMMTAVRYVD